MGIPQDPGYRRAISAYADVVTVIMLDTSNVEAINTILREY